jgi:hypothetical protein
MHSADRLSLGQVLSGEGKKLQELTTSTSTSSINFSFGGETSKNCKLTMVAISDPFLSIIFVVYILAYVIFAFIRFITVKYK